MKKHVRRHKRTKENFFREAKQAGKKFGQTYLEWKLHCGFMNTLIDPSLCIGDPAFK